MQLKLSSHYDFKNLIKFTLPSIIMMVFTSIYGVVDGLFVSNFVGKNQFTAINLIFPFIMALSSIGFMFGSGGSALVGKNLGEGEFTKANSRFSLVIITAIITGVIFSVLGIIFIKPISIFLGAEGEILDYCVLYGTIILAVLPAFMLQTSFQNFLITAEKPKFGLLITVLAGVTNMVLDALLIAVFKCGLVGAAVATATSQLVGGLIPLFYFLSNKNNSLIKITKPKFEIKAILKTCSNGISEFLSNVSGSLLSMIYNFQLLKYIGNNGVAAYGVIMYVQFVFIAVFLGYSIGTAPLFSYNYGADNKFELKNLFKKSVIFYLVTGVIMVIIANLLATTICKIFVGYDDELYGITLRAFRIASFSYLICGTTIFSSAFFTALNNGLISAVISFVRTLIFQTLSILILPTFLQVDGIWLSIIIAEIAAIILATTFLITNRKKYGY